MKKIMMMVLSAVILAGCRGGSEEVFVQKESAAELGEVAVDFASTNVKVTVGEGDEVETHMTVYDSGPGVSLDRNGDRLTIKVDSNAIRLVNLKKKPSLEVRIPESFNGTLVLDGSSGNVSGEELGRHRIEVETSSGDVDVHVAELQAPVSIKTRSGKASVRFEEERPDLKLDVSTNSGSQSIGVDLDGKSTSKKGVSGVSGGGSHEVKIETRSGGVRVE
ncbi:DUF4097 family beta strand repeat-containing protein [Rossellomorea marisflavi]|uniref:DUF4097 family beta strand repeat-containing protein n=1 Tax=Rossellomorea marisflavi TaxID=189381 RepID=UPI00345DA6D8